MKTVIHLILFVLLTSASVNAQEQGRNATDIMNDPEMKSEIFQLILSSDDLRSVMLEELMKNAEKNPDACKHMCSMMMNDDHMAEAIAEKVLELQKKKEEAAATKETKSHKGHFHKSKQH